MMNMCDAVQTDYKDWKLISLCNIEEQNAIGLYFCHKKTGLKVFHLANEDKENLFSFAFNTVPCNSMGLPHIMEHSVLCGSKKYPCRDPFLQLMKQSVNTFLNAMTASDITMYPASSTLEADYFNLMSVYADAVFFPLLKESMFFQEAWHLEVTDSGKPFIKGVVFNEMQGAYNDFDSVATDNIMHSVLPDTAYSFDSGGDPVDIPHLTYSQYLDFHKTYYSPSNCFVFLCGNIDTKKQLDFIQENVIDRLDVSYFSHSLPKDLPPVLASKPLGKNAVARYLGPFVNEDDDETKSNVCLAYRMPQLDDATALMEMNLLEELLLGHDGAFLSKALLESGLGESLDSNNGLWTWTRQGIFSFGLCKVKKEDEEKVRQVVQKTLQEIFQNGVKKDVVAAALMALDFFAQEKNRSQGPYSLFLMRKVLHAWQYGADIFLMLQPTVVISSLKKKICEDENYIKGLVKKYFLDNNDNVLVSSTPNRSYLKQREKQIQDIANELYKNTTKQKVMQQVKDLNDEQLKDDSKQAALIPHIQIQDLDKNVEKINFKHEVCDFGGQKMNVFSSMQDVKDIVYLSLLFPFDTIQAKYYQYIPLLCGLLTSCGWKGKTWDVAVADFAKCIGQISVGQNINAIPKGLCGMKEKKEYAARYYIEVKIKLLSSYLQNALDLLGECFCNVDFGDTKRVKDILQKTNFQNLSSLIPQGHQYVATRCACDADRLCATKEILSGVCAVSFSSSVLKQDMKSLCSTFSFLWKKVKESGTVFHITATQDNLEKLKCLLPGFAKKAQLCSLKPPLETSMQDLLPYIKDYRKNHLETLVVSSLVGFAGTCFCLKEEDKAEYTQALLQHLVVLAKLLSSGTLWEIIRTKGGAYGAYAKEDMTRNLFSFFTYRDPSPDVSLNTFIEVLKDLVQSPLSKQESKQEIEKTIIGCYSQRTMPESPQDASSTQLKREFSLITDEKRQENMNALISTTFQDVKKAAEFLLSKLQYIHSVLICNETCKENVKKDKMTSKISKITL